MKRVIAVLMLILLAALPCMDALAYKSTTIAIGSTGSEVKKMQQALIDLGYLEGKADGKFGAKTEKAVKSFQKSVGLYADGLAGTKTLEKLYDKQNAKKRSSSSSSKSSSKGSSSSSSLFGGDYTTLREGSTDKKRVKALQKALISLKYLSGSADGKYGPKTTEAVKSFQTVKKLTADGLAGQRTLQALEKAYANRETKPSGRSTSGGESSGGSGASGGGSSGGDDDGFTRPSNSQIQKLYWYTDIKNKLIRAGQNITVYDPATGKHWTLRLLSLGRHADAEPLTQKDTDTLVSAFGGKNTWNQKAVYVRFPNGTWTIASTHDMPHESGNIKNNGFNGHLCVHFIRTMEEAQKNDPNYGVDNQKTIRAQWNRISSSPIED